MRWCGLFKSSSSCAAIRLGVGGNGTLTVGGSIGIITSVDVPNNGGRFAVSSGVYAVFAAVIPRVS